MVYGTGFENRRGCKPSKSSNLFSSAEDHMILLVTPVLARQRPDMTRGFYTHDVTTRSFVCVQALVLATGGGATARECWARR